MGSHEVKLDHQLTYELWLDDKFWESAPSWEQYREQAEEEAAHAFEARSSLLLRNNSLYTKWIREIVTKSFIEPAAVKEITDYIKRRRRNRKEAIVIPAIKGREKIVLSDEA